MIFGAPSAYGYMPLSQSCIESIQSELDVQSSQLKERIMTAEVNNKIGAEWIWMNVLASPGPRGLTLIIKRHVLEMSRCHRHNGQHIFKSRCSPYC